MSDTINQNFTILIPTLNEEKNIKRLIETILSLYPSINITVVDDGSTDDTVKLVNEFNDVVSLINRKDNDIKGLSISIKEGIFSVKTKFFMVIDGDFQHPPEAIKDAITCSDENPEFIIGHRIKVEEWPFLRKLMSQGAKWLATISLLFRRKKVPKDIMSGFFGGNTTYIQTLLAENSIEDTGYKILFDLLKAAPRNVSISQFGYVFKNREFGDSKIGKTQMIAFLRSLI